MKKTVMDDYNLLIITFLTISIIISIPVIAIFLFRKLKLPATITKPAVRVNYKPTEIVLSNYDYHLEDRIIELHEGVEGAVINFPSDKSLAILAYLVYNVNLLETIFSKDIDKNTLLQSLSPKFAEQQKNIIYVDCLLRVKSDWKLVTTARHENDGYFGAAFWNVKEKQLVISHCGTRVHELQSLFADIDGIMRNRHTSQIDSACTFVALLMERLRMTDKNKIQISITGHSLGAWLAQITAFSLKYFTLDPQNQGFKAKNEDDGSYDVHTVGFESPGCRRMLVKIFEMYYPRYEYPNYNNCWKDLDISLYFTRPNMFNTLSKHVGKLYQIEIGSPVERKFMNKLHAIQHYHSIWNILAAMINGTTVKRILDWPLVEFPERRKNDGLKYNVRKWLYIFALYGQMPAFYYDYFDTCTHELDEFWRRANVENNFSPDPDDLNYYSRSINLHYRVENVEI